LKLVDDSAAPFLFDHLHRVAELTAAIALGRAEDIAGQTLRMDAHQRGNIRSHLALEEGDKFFVADKRAIAGNLELAYFGW
jgi:hypothetical protein